MAIKREPKLKKHTAVVSGNGIACRHSWRYLYRFRNDNNRPTVKYECRICGASKEVET